MSAACLASQQKGRERLWKMQTSSRRALPARLRPSEPRRGRRSDRAAVLPSPGWGPWWPHSPWALRVPGRATDTPLCIQQSNDRPLLSLKSGNLQVGNSVQMVTIAVGSAQHAEDARILSHDPQGPQCCYPRVTHEGTQARSRAPTRRAGMHILTLDHPCRAPGPRCLSCWPRASAGRAAPGSGTSQEDNPRALGTIKRPLSFSSCLTAPSVPGRIPL